VVDRFLLLLLQIGVIIVAVLIGAGFAYSGDISGLLIGALFVILGFSEFLYFGYFEWRRNGSTPGKKRAGTKVVMAGGHRLTSSAVLIRNLFRPIDMLPPVWIVPLLDRKHRRIGDFVAGTVVVRQAQMGTRELKQPLSQQKYADLSLQYLNIGAGDQGHLGIEEYQAIEMLLERHKHLPLEKRDGLCELVLTPILIKLKRERPDRQAVRAKVLLEEIYLALRDNPRLMD